MANSPQARKRVRQTARRTAVNRARVSQYRTYVKKVETAIASGDGDDGVKRQEGDARIGGRLSTDQISRYRCNISDLGRSHGRGPFGKKAGLFFDQL